ncbi:MAG: hypothetical protein H0V50_02770 [Thermoleophilaceae bacterium]|nr:hypothetical protein [Thermoleophilaceae bacterium]
MTNYQPRRSEVGTVFGYTTPEGNQKTIRADDSGLVTPRDSFEDAILAGQGLKVAREPASTTTKAAASTTTKVHQPAPTPVPVKETGAEG